MYGHMGHGHITNPGGKVSRMGDVEDVGGFFCSIQLTLSLSHFWCQSMCCIKIQMKWLCWTQGRKESILHNEKLSKKKKKRCC